MQYQIILWVVNRGVFQVLKKQKIFVKKKKKATQFFAPEAEEINNSKIIDEKIEDLFIIKEVIIDNNISYEWEKILEQRINFLYFSKKIRRKTSNKKFFCLILPKFDFF